MIDYHIHSNFSVDSSMEMETACTKAIDLKLDEIAFTDHIDIDYPDPDFIFDLDIYDYLNQIQKIQQKYKNQLKIKKSIEIGLQPHVLSETNDKISGFEFDFIIASVHGVSKTDMHNGDYFRTRDQKQGYIEYLFQLFDMLQNFNNYDVLGHFDIIRRYSDRKTSLYDIDKCRPIIDQILNLLIKKNKCLEINTSGFRYGINSIMPDINILKRYKYLGGKLITVGSDAHLPAQIAYNFQYTYKTIKKVGFNYITTFDKRTPVLKAI